MLVTPQKPRIKKPDWVSVVALGAKVPIIPANAWYGNFNELTGKFKFNKHPAISKKAGGNGLYDAVRGDETVLKALFIRPGHWNMVGIRTGATPEGSGFDLLDVDLQHPEAAAFWAANKDRFPRTPKVHTPSGGLHLYLQHREGQGNITGCPTKGIDVRGDNGLCWAWFLNEYQSENFDISPQPWPDIPEIPLSQPKKARAAAPSTQTGYTPPATEREARARAIADALMGRPIGIEEGSRDVRLFKWACKLVTDGWEFDRILQDARYCNSTFKPPLSDAEVEAKVESAWKYAEETTVTVEAPVPGAPAGVPPVPVQIPAFSDDHLAVELVNRHSHEIRYTAQSGRYHRFTGQRWEPDNTLAVYEMARLSNRDIANGPKLLLRTRRSIVSAKTRSATEQLARGDRRIAATVSQWDADPWALNTPGGIIDLKAGTIRSQRPEDYCTKITGAAPGGESPRWHQFIHEITGGDRELADYLQLAAGYSLTGVTVEHVLFFLYGHGGNGKGVYMATLAELLGGYHCTAPIETFTVSRSDRHPTELAKLVGARWVTATETQEGRNWDETKIKTLTGGDEVSARFMRQDFFDYKPQFKLTISGNHRPGLRSVDEAIRRRMRLIPFDVTIPAHARDLDLIEKLKAELPGIMVWALNGCMAWQRHGLKTPQRVMAATDAYFAHEDIIGNWIAEKCVLDPEAWTPTTRLHRSFQLWAYSSDEKAMGIRDFSQRISLHPKLTFQHRKEGNGYCGIAERELPRIGG
jgi:putative DNA primase/helicase